jgi:pimeloyl-ACP methyl ester carboxylesterase
MTALVLLHSPLIGRRSWARAGSLLPNAAIPDYAAVFDGDPLFYPRIVCAIASQIPDGDLVLVAHSGAGALIPLLAQHIGPSVRGAIFADAILPHPQKSWMDTAPVPLASHLRAIQKDGHLPPWNRWWPKETLTAMLPDVQTREAFIADLRSVPMSYLEECAPQTMWPANLTCAYLQLSEGYASEAQTARDLGWHMQALALNHLAMLTDPGAVAAALQSMADKILVNMG